MQWSLRTKLIAAFLSITAIFAVISVFTMLSLRDIGESSQRFVGEYWPTADFLMETQIFFHEISDTVLEPPDDVGREELIDSLLQEVSEHRQQLRALPLAQEDIAVVDNLLAQMENALEAPLRLYGLPGLRMEEADAAVQPVLEIAIELGQVDLITSLWESVMAFNDYLITGDQEERENFAEQTQWIEAHPAFSRLRQDYDPYKQKALEVFEASRQWQQARGDFLSIGRSLAKSLKDLEDRYHDSVLEPAASGMLSSIRRTSGALLASVAVCLLLSLTIGTLLARRLGRVVDQVLRQAQQVRDGHLGARLQLGRQDEFGHMADAMDAMAERLAEVVQRIGGTAGQLGAVADRLTETAGEVEMGARRQSRGVEETSGAVRRIQETVGELGAGVEQMRGSVSETTVTMLQMSANIEEVAQNTDQLAAAVDEVHASIAEMTASIREIAASAGNLKEAAEVNTSSVGEMDASIRQIEELARETAGIAEEVRREAENGQQTVADTTAGIDEIGRAMQATAEVVRSLSEDVQSIDNIVSVIEDVTEQTNLLALNAAIIAAQAGEHGRGFAVVAEEIRDLSERTSGSTREISRVISTVQQGSERVVATMEMAQQRIVAGEGLSRRSGAALARIVAGVQGAAQQMEKIVLSTGEQTRGSRMLSDSMERMARMTEQIAVAVAQQSKGSEMIMSAAGRMQDITVQVRSSTREQSKASQAVAHTTQAIEEMFGRIHQISGIQQHESEAIVGAVGNIEQSAAAGSACADVLKEVVAHLATEVRALEREISYFSDEAVRQAK
jgi:methyl-accepting chemotaxis protein